MAAAGFRTASLALLCAGCTSINATQATLEGTRWRVASINAVPTPPYRFWFSGGYMRGDICNRFEAPFSVARDGLWLHGFMSTERGCSGQLEQFENAGFAILHQPMRMNWRSGHRLRLSNRAGSIELELNR